MSQMYKTIFEQYLNLFVEIKKHGDSHCVLNT